MQIEYNELLDEIKTLVQHSAFIPLIEEKIFIEQQTKRMLDICFPFLLETIYNVCDELTGNYLNIKIEPAANSIGGMIAKDESGDEWFRKLVFYKDNQQVKVLNLYIIKKVETENQYYIINKN